jgi:hypothetical protein
LEEGSWLLTEEIHMGEPSLDSSTSLSKAEFQSHSDALKEMNGEPKTVEWQALRKVCMHQICLELMFHFSFSYFFFM